MLSNKKHVRKILKTCNVNGISAMVFFVVLEGSEVVTIMRASVFPSVCLSLFTFPILLSFPFVPASIFLLVRLMGL